MGTPRHNYPSDPFPLTVIIPISRLVQPTRLCGYFDCTQGCGSHTKTDFELIGWRSAQSLRYQIIPREHRTTYWSNRSVSGTWYFSNFSFVIFHGFLCCSILPHSFPSVSLIQKRQIRMLLIPRRSRAQRTTTTDDPF